MRPMPTSPAAAAAPEAPTGPSPALVHDLSLVEAKGDSLGSLTLGEGAEAVDFEIKYVPSAYLVSKLAGLDAEQVSEEALQMLPKFFKFVLGDEAFEVFDAKMIDDRVPTERMVELMQEVMVAASGRPT